MLAGRRWIVVVVIAFVVLRLPSFVERTWYSDDGTYANIGWALNHGARLYIDVWDNKPPGIYWLCAFLVGHLPIGLIAPLSSSLITAITAGCVAFVGRTLGGARVAAAATVAYVVVASLPVLHGTLLNAEVCGAACVALAMAVLLRSTSRPWSVVAGMLVGAAFLFKAVFAADVAVILGVPAIIAVAQGQRPAKAAITKPTLAILAGFLITIGAATVTLLWQGSLGAAVAVVTHGDLNYVAAYGSGELSGAAGAATIVARVLIPVVAGFALTWRLGRSGRRTGALLAWWLGWDVAAAMVSGRGFPHYVQQAEPVVCIALAVALSALWQRRGRQRFLAVSCVAGALVACELVLWVPSAEVSLAAGHGIPEVVDDGVTVGQVPAYYAHGYRRLIDPRADPQFEALFPVDLALQRTVVKVFDTYSRPGDRVFVWGSIPWAYVLSKRMPAGRYVTLNSAYHVDPAAQSELLGDLEAHVPKVMVVEARPGPDALLAFFRRHGYQRVASQAGAGDIWRLPS